MDTTLSQKQIGTRLAKLRKLKGLSQEELAKNIKISRPSLAQIELGNRSVSILEMQRLAWVLAFSIDSFIAPNLSVVEEPKVAYEPKIKVTEERISVPTLDVNKLKNVLLYLLERGAGKPNVGETVLQRLLYFCDFNYYEIYEEHLTGNKYRKLPQGPAPEKLDTILEQMLENGQLQKIKTTYHNTTQTRFLPLEKADLTQLKASEKDVMDKVIEQMGDWNEPTISDYACKDLPWVVTEDGKKISYNLAFYREAPYSVRAYDESENED
ncbi:MAG: type II toxin-antitoxin system antitoxin SocA domain-containing protein [Chitinophagaceae bacterium]